MKIDLKNKKILVTGGAGFLGSYVVDQLIKKGISRQNIVIPRSSKHDLRQEKTCRKVLKDIHIVIHLAGNVGGIGYNQKKPGELFYDNLIMGVQLMEAARNMQIEKFVAIGTVCSYPKHTPIPFKEISLWNGYPEETNAPYGLAKKMLLVQAQAYRQQYGFNAIYLIPVNLYGPKDNFSDVSSHVIPALINKIHKAKMTNSQSVEIWGDGKATREFLYAADSADAIVRATEIYNNKEPINLGSGKEISIKDLVSKITKYMNYSGKIIWNKSKPNGQPRRMLDTSKAEKEFGFRARTNFDLGLKKTIEWYLKNYRNLDKQ